MAEVQQLPIDIHSGRLLDWLLSRRHCNKEWQSKVLIIREKIKHAILDMPEDERILKLLQGAYINYFHCVQIVDILKETEKDTKNFLGFYSSQRMNDWLQIKKLYEKDNVYLAEAAQILQRLVQYDIPALKKQIAKCDSTVSDCLRKEEDYIKQALSSKKAYEKELQKMGIQGKILRREIQLLSAELPVFFKAFAKDISQIVEPLEYYRNFRKYLHQGKTTETKLLPLCTLLLEKGPDVTVFEWKYNKKPISIERPNTVATSLAEEEEFVRKENEIDFGNDDEIDFGGGDSIDFGEACLDFNLGNGDIAGIEVVDECQAVLGNEVARGMEALYLLENPETRSLIMQELKELLTFLIFRGEDESAEDSASLYISGIENRPADISAVSLATISKWKSQVSETYSKLADPDKLRLFKIYTSPEYVSTIVDSLEQKRSLEGRYETMRSVMAEKRSETLFHASKVQAQLNQIIEATKLLQQQLETEISKKYHGTPVNIMGGIVAALKTN